MSPAKDDINEAYTKYCISCIFSHRDFWTEERIMSFEEFQEQYQIDEEADKNETK